jgi:integrase
MSGRNRAEFTGRKRGPYKRAAKNEKAHQSANTYAVTTIRFLLLTGCREREALTLRWSDVNLERGTATLPDTKTDKSERFLGAPARLLLSRLPHEGDSPRAFPGCKVG